MLIQGLPGGEVIGGARVGETKVRDLEWIDDTRILVTTSSTETMPLIGLDQSEVFIGQIFNVTTGRIVQLLRPTRSLFPGLMSGVRIRHGGDRPDLYDPAHFFDQTHYRHPIARPLTDEIAETLRGLGIEHHLVGELVGAVELEGRAVLARRNEGERADIYTRITEKIVADLEKGVRPWMQPWRAGNAIGRVTRPLRHNGLPYAGMNVLLLWSEALARGFTSPVWMTCRCASWCW